MKGVIWIALPDHNLSLRERQELQGETWLPGLLCISLIWLCLARFLICPTSTCPRMAHPTVGWCSPTLAGSTKIIQ